MARPLMVRPGASAPPCPPLATPLAAGTLSGADSDLKTFFLIFFAQLLKLVPNMTWRLFLEINQILLPYFWSRGRKPHWRA